MNRSFLVWSAITLLATGCSTAALRSEPRPRLARAFVIRPAPSNEDWLRNPPPPLPSVSVPLPIVVERRLISGVRLLVVERHDFPSVSLAFVRNRTVCDDAAAVEIFANSFGGSRWRTRPGEPDDLRSLGISYRSAVWGHDVPGLSATVLPALLPVAIARLAPVLLSPRLSAEELVDARRTSKAHLANADTRSINLKDRALYGSLFGPAGHGAILVDPGEIDGVSDARVRAYAESIREPGHATVIAVGDTTADRIVELLERATADRPHGEAGARPCDPLSASTPDGSTRVIDVPGAEHSYVSIGAHGVPWGDPDAAALAILSEILGASLSNRLGLRVRTEHGWTAGVRVTSKGWQTSGILEVIAVMETERTAEAVSGLLAELDRAGDEPVSDAELRRTLSLELPSFGSHEDTATSLIGVAAYGLPADTLARHEQALRSVTTADVARVARKYFGTPRRVVTIIGDVKRVGLALREQGLGPLDVVTP